MNLEELKARLEAEGYNEQFYCIGPGWGRLSDGFALEAVPEEGGYEFFYTERGQKSRIEFFDDESDACQYVYDYLAKDKWSRSHMIGFYDSKEQAEDLKRWLEKLGIESFSDAIPYGGPNDLRHRVFVFGTDFQKVKDLRGDTF